MKPNFALLALAVGAFAIGTTEFSPMGFLPQIAQGLHHPSILGHLTSVMPLAQQLADWYLA